MAERPPADAPNPLGQARPATGDDILEIAQDAYAALPASMRAAAGHTMIAVEELADASVTRTLGLSSPFELLALYEAGDRPGEGRLRLYRRAILDYWIERGDSLAYVIRHLLAEEINRHFGK